MSGPTSAQTKQWERAKKLAEALNMRTNALRLRGKNIQDAMLICHDYGLPFPRAGTWITQVRAAQDRDLRIQRTVSAVIVGKLGLRGSVNIPGDLDIMAEPHVPSEELTDYINFSFPWIIVGVVVAVGITAMFIHEHEQAKELRNQYKPLKKKADEILCADPNSEQCLKWKGKQAEVEFQARKSTWERLESGAENLLGSAQTGLKIAIPVVIGLVLLSWLNK